MSKALDKRTERLNPTEAQVIARYLADPQRRKGKAYFAVHGNEEEGMSKAITVAASRMFAKPRINRIIQQREREVARRFEISHERITQELASIAFAQTGDFLQWDSQGVTITPSQDIHSNIVSAVQSVEEVRTNNGKTIRLRLHDKQKALELLGKQLGMFREQTTVEPGEGWTEVLQHVHGRTIEGQRVDGGNEVETGESGGSESPVLTHDQD